MAKKFEIRDSALVVTDTGSGDIELHRPARDCWAYFPELRDNNVILINDTNAVNASASRLYYADLADAVDENDVSFNQTSWLEWVQKNLGFNRATGSVAYAGEFNNYTDLTTSEPAGTAGRFAFVLNSQGTKWLPGSLGGSFYGAGWYYDTGSQWVSKNDEIYKGIEDLVDDKVNRFSIDLDSSEISVTRTVSGGRTTFTITHNFNSLDVIAQVYRISNSRDVGWRIQRNGVNELEASRAGTISDAEYRIVILN